MADTIKCPNCAANLVFDAETQKMACDFCGAAFSTEELKSVVDELEKQIAEEKAQEKESEVVEVETEDGVATEFTCNACGGKVVTDENTSATFCPFCGSPALVGERLTGKFKPKYVIPFKYSRSQAEKAFLKYCKGGRYTPFNFVSKSNIEKMTGLYVPFWLFSNKINVSIQGTGIKTRYSGDYEYTDHYNIKRYGKVVLENIPFDGETRIDDKLMEALEPFDYTELTDYDYKYLPGFFADRFDQDPVDLRKRVDKRVRDYFNDSYKKTVSKYKNFRITDNKTVIHEPEAQYALLPIWFLQYKYLGKQYFFAMNGQTGKTAGTIPISPVKKLMLFSVILAVTAVIVRIILGFIMGGFVG